MSGSTISNPKNDRRSLTHTFSEVEDQNGRLNQNETGRYTEVLAWTCPRKFKSIRYAAGRHRTKFVPRYKMSKTGSDFDAQNTIAVDGTLVPPSGEELPQDQPYPPVVAYNVTDDTDYTDDLTYDYAYNEVTLPEDPESGDNIVLYPILVEGEVQYRGLDQFDHTIAPLDEWGVSLRNFHHFNQEKNQTQIHLIGAVQWKESETLSVQVRSPQQIVWEDADYPHGQYVSTIEQRVDVSV